MSPVPQTSNVNEENIETTVGRNDLQENPWRLLSTKTVLSFIVSGNVKLFPLTDFHAYF